MAARRFLAAVLVAASLVAIGVLSAVSVFAQSPTFARTGVR